MDTKAIDTETQIIPLIGLPLTQSFAARMQNKAYEANGDNIIYTYMESDTSNLEGIINGIRNIPSFIGCAVTKPNKVKVMQYLDDIDPMCRKMGACNTVLKTSENRLIGFNTDYVGFSRYLIEETPYRIPEMSVFLIGAGGAGRAIAAALAEYGVKELYITDAYLECSSQLVSDINSNWYPCAAFVPFGDFDVSAKCNFIINASGIGMGSTVGQTPFPFDKILPSQVFFDACYNPEKTQFLINAEKCGCPTMNGLGMSLYQGAAQIEIWTKKSAPIEIMRNELLQIIKQ